MPTKRGLVQTTSLLRSFRYVLPSKRVVTRGSQIRLQVAISVRLIVFLSWLSKLYSSPSVNRYFDTICILNVDSRLGYWKLRDELWQGEKLVFSLICFFSISNFPMERQINYYFIVTRRWFVSKREIGNSVVLCGVKTVFWRFIIYLLLWKMIQSEHLDVVFLIMFLFF